jgi:hypothetical protein
MRDSVFTDGTEDSTRASSENKLGFFTAERSNFAYAGAVATAYSCHNLFLWGSA